MISLNRNCYKVINLLFVLPFGLYLNIYLSLRKYCNFGTKNPRCALHYSLVAVNSPIVQPNCSIKRHGSVNGQLTRHCVGICIDRKYDVAFLRGARRHEALWRAFTSSASKGGGNLRYLEDIAEGNKRDVAVGGEDTTRV